MTEQVPAEQRAAPLFAVVSGDPTAEEVAALVAVLSFRAGTERSSDPAVAPSAWSAPSRRMRGDLRHGPDAWRRSALPQ